MMQWARKQPVFHVCGRRPRPPVTWRQSELVWWEQFFIVANHQMGKTFWGHAFDYYQWLHDPNLTVSVLLCMLVRWCEKYQLPPVLYLQLDNCVKENMQESIYFVASCPSRGIEDF